MAESASEPQLPAASQIEALKPPRGTWREADAPPLPWTPQTPPAQPVLQRIPLLFLTVFVIAGCGLVYELTAGALASYVLGDSITQFSTVIGTYLSALGVGAWL